MVSYYVLKINQRNKDLIKEIEKYIDILLKRFFKDKPDITNILAELVLGIGSSQDGDLKQLEALGDVIIKGVN